MSETIDHAHTSDPDRSFFGHPRGLMYLAAMEGFERFSYYGMQALLVLYMTGRLFHPGVIDHVIGFAAFRAGLEAALGHMTLQALALQIFGLYGGLVYLLPLVGGYIGDQLLGRRRTIIVGLMVMAAGHCLMAFEQTFLFALLALLTGSALLKGNVAAQVSSLYRGGDGRRDQGFSIFLMSANTGAVLSPLVCGTLGELYGWHYGFGAAAVVVLVGLAIYLLTSRRLPDDPPRRQVHAVITLQPGDGARIGLLFAVAAVASLFWVAQSQIWNAYPVWVRDRVDRHIFGVDMPVTWFQSVDSIGTIIFGPMVIWLWARQQRRANRTRRSDQDRLGGHGLRRVRVLVVGGRARRQGRQGRDRVAAELSHPFRAWLALFHARGAGAGRADCPSQHPGHRHRRGDVRDLHRRGGERLARQVLRRYPKLAVLGPARQLRPRLRYRRAGADPADEKGACEDRRR